MLNSKIKTKRIIYLIGIITCIVLTAKFIFNSYLYDFKGPGYGELTINVQKGSTGENIASTLKNEGIIKTKIAFLDEYNGDKSSHRITPGNYTFKKEMKAHDALQILLKPIKERDNSTVITINPGFIQDDVFLELKNKMHFSDDELNKLASNPSQFSIPKQAKNLEGYLAPNVYTVNNRLNAKEIIQLMVNHQKEILNKEGVVDENEQYKILTIASIAQKEGMHSDYARIVGILNNRLNINNKETYGFLQLDSTVNYGIKKFKLTTTDTQRADMSNIYNTYAHPGLPPGPIANTSKDAIHAAIHPEKNNYFYWVTVNPTTGETKFAKTFSEHIEYTQEFIAWCNLNPKTCGAESSDNF